MTNPKPINAHDAIHAPGVSIVLVLHDPASDHPHSIEACTNRLVPDCAEEVAKLYSPPRGACWAAGEGRAGVKVGEECGEREGWRHVWLEVVSVPVVETIP